jgi:PAS domain S-box-containing protein
MVDLRMPELDGLELLRLSSELEPDIPKIVISGANQIDDVVQALRYGAWDYLVKPVKDLSMLGHAVRNALDKARLLQENRTYQEHLEDLVRDRTLELEQANNHLSRINSRLKKIVETTRGLSACIEMNAFGSQILDEFAHHMVATGGSLYFIEKEGLRRMQSLDPGHAPDFIKFPLAKDSILQQVITSGKPMLVGDVADTKSIKPSGWTGYKDGSLLAFPIPDNDGNILGILSLHSKKEPPFIEQDKEIGAILASYSCETLRAVKAFEALQKSERQYKTLFEKTNDAIFIVEKNTGRHIDANEAAVTLTGRPLNELKQMTLHHIAPESAKKWLITISDINRTTDLGEVTVCRPDNTCRIARVSSVPLDDKVVVSMARDITHDKEIESQLRQSQKMEAIGTLAGGIAHDFNNILSSIFGYAQLVEMDIDDPVKAKKNIGQVVKGAHRAADLVQQILTFSRKTEHNRTPLKLFIIVKEAIKFLRSSIPATIEIDDKVLSKATILAEKKQSCSKAVNILCLWTMKMIYSTRFNRFWRIRGIKWLLLKMACQHFRPSPANRINMSLLSLT